LAGQKEPTLARLRAAMREAAGRDAQHEVDRLRGVLRDVQTLTIQPSPLAGLPPGWRLLALERLPGGDTRTHLIEDGRLLASASWGHSELPNDLTNLARLAREIVATAPAVTHTGHEYGLQPSHAIRTHDGAEDPPSMPDRAELVHLAGSPQREAAHAIVPEESTIVLRWLAHARDRIEVRRVFSDDRLNGG
jgi:hypothetical protein